MELVGAVMIATQVRNVPANRSIEGHREMARHLATVVREAML